MMMYDVCIHRYLFNTYTYMVLPESAKVLSCHEIFLIHKHRYKL